MAKYFNFFPKTLYSQEDKKTNLETVTNIISRFTFENDFKENSSVFYEYEIQEGDTPEIIAYKFYNNVERHWIVLTYNNIIDPYYDWPLSTRQFNEYVNRKYSSPEYADTANTSVSGLSWAKNVNNVHSYYKVVTTTVQYPEKVITIDKMQVDANTYANNTIMENGTNQNYTLGDNTTVNITITKETKSHFTFENEENEKKRKIKLLKPEFVTAVEKEFKRVISL